MKKSFKTLISTLVLTSLCLTGVYAANMTAVLERRLEEGEARQGIRIKGNLESFVKGENVTVKIIKSGSDLNNAGFDDYSGFYQTAINDNGSFDFLCEFENEAAEYDIIVTSENEVCSAKLYVPTTEGISALIASLNDKTAAPAGVVSLIETNNSELAFDTAIFDQMPQEAKEKTIRDMQSKVLDFNIENIYKSFSENTLINAVNYGNSDNLAEKALKYYNDAYLKLEEMSVEPLRKKMSDSALKQAYNSMAGNSLSSIEEIKKKYTEAIIISAYKNAASYLNVYDILNDYKSEISIEDEINTLSASNSTKNAVLRYLVRSDVKNSISTLEDLKNKIDYAIANLSSIISSDPTNQSGSGSGGGGGGGGKPTVLTVKDDSPEDNSSNTPSVQISKGLNDLNDAEWAREQILYLYSKGIVSGKGNGSFKPNDKVTRGEIAKMIVTASGIYNPDAVSDFNDVAGHWAAPYVASGANAGYILGKSAEIFGVNDNITRQDIAVIIYRIIQTTAKAQLVANIENKFTDKNEMSDYAMSSIEMLYHYGVIKGFDDGSFKPKNGLTRAEAAVMIKNYLDFIEKEN